MAQEVPAGTTTSEATAYAREHNNKPTMAEKMKLGIANVKTRFTGTGSNPTTPRSPASTGTSTAAAGDVAEESVPLKKTDSKKETHPASPAGGGRVGDGVFSPTPSPSISRREGDPTTPKLPAKDLGERIMEKLPFSHTNPYSVGHTPSMPEPGAAANPHVSETESMSRTGPATQSPSSPTTATSPGIMGKLKNMVTGQKPTQGTATDNATIGTAGTPGAAATGGGGTHQGYVQTPKPQNVDLYDRVRETMSKERKAAAHGGSDTGSEEVWPTPSKPGSTPSKPAATTPEGGATFADEKGHPIEGPTQPRSEDTKKEGLTSKLADKFHLN